MTFSMVPVGEVDREWYQWKRSFSGLGYPACKHNSPPDPRVNYTWVCTLPLGHLGQHVGHFDAGQVCGRWGELGELADLAVEEGL